MDRTRHLRGSRTDGSSRRNQSEFFLGLQRNHRSSKKEKEEQDLDTIRLSFIGVSLEGVEEFVLRFFSKKENEKDDDSRRYVSLIYI